ncbi:unnamed protein product, partial [Rotaria magnacalcarata]
MGYWKTGVTQTRDEEVQVHDIIGISEVRWTGKGETSNGDFIWSREDNTH